MQPNDIENLTDRLRNFTNARDWEQFHSPKNLMLALVGEVGELSEIFQWLSDEESLNLSKETLDHTSHEIADVFLYLLQLCDALNIDLISSAHKKIDLNNKKYPVIKCKGSPIKYTKL